MTITQRKEQEMLFCLDKEPKLMENPRVLHPPAEEGSERALISATELTVLESYAPA